MVTTMAHTLETLQQEHFTITQGVTFLPGSTSNAAAASSTEEARHKHFLRIEDVEEDDRAAYKRQELYDNAVETFEHNFSETIAQSYQSLIEATVGYLFEEAPRQRSGFNRKLECAVVGRCSSEVAAEVIRALSNRGGLTQIENGEPWVITLGSKESQKLSSLIRQIMDEMFDRRPAGFDLSTKALSNLTRSAVRGELDILCGWFNAVCHYRKRVKSTHQDPAIFLVLERAESYDWATISDLILLFMQRPELPVKLLVLSLLPASMVINRLPLRASQCINIHSFESPCLEDVFSHICYRLLILRTFPLVLGPNAFAFLRSQFFRHDLSLTRLKTSLRYILFHHFFSNPLSLFTQDHLTSSLEQCLSLTTMDYVRGLPSFQRHFSDWNSTTNPSFLYDLIADDKVALHHVVKVIAESKAMHSKRLMLGFRLRQQLARLTKHRGLSDLIRIAMSNDQSRERDLLEVKRVIQNSDEAVLSKIFASVESIIDAEEIVAQDGPTKTLRTLFAELKGTRLRGEDGLRLQAEVKDLTMQSASKSLRSEDSDQFLGLSRSKSKSKKRGLQSTNARVRDEMNSFFASSTQSETYASRLGGLLYDMLRHLLRPPTDLPCHEAFYYDRDDVLMNAFSFSTRSVVVDSLAKPEIFLNLTSTPTKAFPPDAPGTLPDISTLYRQSLEAGRVLNLCDWYTAYETTLLAQPPYVNGGVHSPALSGGLPPVSDNSQSMYEAAHDNPPVDQSCSNGEVQVSSVSAAYCTDTDIQLTKQVRFARGVAELKYLGLFKDTQRKVHHLEKLIF